MNNAMFLWGFIAFLIIGLPTITGLMRVNAALKFLESGKGKFKPLAAIKQGGIAYALTFSFKISFITAVILDYIEYVKQTYFITSLYIFFIVINFIVQNSGKQFVLLSKNLSSAFFGASVVAIVIFVLNFSIQRKLKKVLPAEIENIRKGRTSTGLKKFDQTDHLL